MTRPPLEVADIIRAAGKDFIKKHRSWLTGLHRTALLSGCKNLLGDDLQITSMPAETTETEEPATWLCPLCRGRMIVIERFTASQFSLQTLKEKDVVDLMSAEAAPN